MTKRKWTVRCKDQFGYYTYPTHSSRWIELCDRQALEEKIKTYETRHAAECARRVFVRVHVPPWHTEYGTKVEDFEVVQVSIRGDVVFGKTYWRKIDPSEITEDIGK